MLTKHPLKNPYKFGLSMYWISRPGVLIHRLKLKTIAPAQCTCPYLCVYQCVYRVWLLGASVDSDISWRQSRYIIKTSKLSSFHSYDPTSLVLPSFLEISIYAFVWPIIEGYTLFDLLQDGRERVMFFP